MKYLVPKQMEAHGLRKKNLRIGEEAIRGVISFYTREAGVRNFEREIAAVCRKAARNLVSTGKQSMTITPASLAKYLGTKRFRYDLANEKDEVGVATGLAWTPVGGETLSIEVTLMDGNGKLELTGQLGDVMKESAMAAVSFIRSRTEQLNIDRDFHKKLDIHIHVPEGAIPKDGPSAGITLATAMISALTGCPIRKNVAMTGEITLRGRVLPIGGLKEKVLAAHRAGLDTIIVPAENKKDIDDIPENVKKVLKFVYASDMEIVLKTALISKVLKSSVKETDEKSKAMINEDVVIADEVVNTAEMEQTH